MARAKKNSHPFSIRMDIEAYDKLQALCEDSGQSNTIAVERAIIQYADEYFEKKKRLSEMNENNQ